MPRLVGGEVHSGSQPAVPPGMPPWIDEEILPDQGVSKAVTPMKPSTVLLKGMPAY